MVDELKNKTSDKQNAPLAGRPQRSGPPRANTDANVPSDNPVPSRPAGSQKGTTDSEAQRKVSKTAQEMHQKKVGAVSKNVIVIKHGTLREMIMCSGAFEAIRERHQDGRVTLLTTKGNADLARQMGYFDDVWIDELPNMWSPLLSWKMRKEYKKRKITAVYDLEMSKRTEWYFRFLGREKPNWCGNLDWCSHPYLRPNAKWTYLSDRLAEQLFVANYDEVSLPHVDYLQGDISRFKETLPEDYVLLVPGTAKGREQDRWPLAEFIRMACWFGEAGTTPIFIGGKSDKNLVNKAVKIAGSKVEVMNLCSQTTLGEVKALAEGAMIAVGNDTAPMSVISLSGCPSITLCQEPLLTVPVVDNNYIISAENLQEVLDDAVIAGIVELLELDKEEKEEQEAQEEAAMTDREKSLLDMKKRTAEEQYIPPQKNKAE